MRRYFWCLLVLSACQETVDTVPADGGGDADATFEASAPRAPPDADVPLEASGGDAPSCQPGDLAGFTPTWFPPAAPQAKCSAADVDKFLSSCITFNSAAPPPANACSDFRLANQLCAACLATSTSASQWGPIVQSPFGPYVDPNIGGCIAMSSGDSTDTSCGAKQQALWWCEQVACRAPACTIAVSPTRGACISAAYAGECRDYAAAASQCVVDMLRAGGPSADSEQLCDVTTYGDNATFYRALGRMFCGAQGDGGTVDSDAAPGAADAGAEDDAYTPGDDGPSEAADAGVASDASGESSDDAGVPND